LLNLDGSPATGGYRSGSQTDAGLEVELKDTVGVLNPPKASVLKAA
jgi:hypothetical protein